MHNESKVFTPGLFYRAICNALGSVIIVTLTLSFASHDWRWFGYNIAALLTFSIFIPFFLNHTVIGQVWLTFMDAIDHASNKKKTEAARARVERKQRDDKLRNLYSRKHHEDLPPNW